MDLDGALDERGRALGQRPVAGLVEDLLRCSPCDSATLGWSNGLMPRIRPATAVAYSQSRNCAPSEPLTATPRRRPGRAPGRARRRGDASSGRHRRSPGRRCPPPPPAGCPCRPCRSTRRSAARPSRRSRRCRSRRRPARACRGRPWPRRPAPRRAASAGLSSSSPSRRGSTARLGRAAGHVDPGQRGSAPARTRSARCSGRPRSGRPARRA